MPFTDPMSSISGRNSRASNVSAMTGASRSLRSGPAPAGQPNDTFASIGVLSMLKTSTDTGDIGSLSFNTSRLPAMPRPAHQRRAHASRPSGSLHNHRSGATSHRYAPSQTSRISDATSMQRRGSLTSMQSMPPSIPPINLSKAAPQMPRPTLDRDSRSYSLTSAPIMQPLPRHRSSTSLKSAGHRPAHARRLHSAQPPMLPAARQPYPRSARLNHPSHRSPSPAVSELSAQGPSLPQPAHQMAPPLMTYAPPQQAMPTLMPRPVPQTYYSDLGTEYANEPCRLNVRPPPRVMNSSPPVGYDPNRHMYRPGPALSQHPGMYVPPRPHPPHQLPLHAPHHGVYPTSSQPQRGYSGHPQMQHSGYYVAVHRGPPPSAPAAPVAASMFHNAARMARQLPQRADTPMTDLGPPSSDPPSSSTAPTSSSPATPKDQTTIHVAVDPLFIDPALTDLPDSSSEPVMPAKYFEFAEGLEKSNPDPDMEIPHPSVPPSGFVQRVKAMLESRAAVEAAARQDVEKVGMIDSARSHDKFAEPSFMEEDPSQVCELAANETPRFTIIEEYEAPVELPASPVKLAELSGTPIQSNKQRITRQLVKAELGPSSTHEDTTLNTETEDASTDSFQTNTLPQDIPGTKLGSPVALKKANEKPATAEPVPATPSTTQSKVTVTQSRVIDSPELSGISGMNYALRFSPPVSAATSDETQSRDPFMLDADTITVRHQQSKEKVETSAADLAQSQQDAVEERLAGIQEDPSPPVSPLLPGEEVKRDSAVSPLHDRALGIEETLHLASAEEQNKTRSPAEPSSLAPSIEQGRPPSSPRASRTPSKSVSLPQSNGSSSETATTNRFSLPADLSTLENTSLNTTSDMITDVAVRFSLPTTTFTIARPQVITIPPSSSPERPPSPPQAKPDSQYLEPKAARRNSVAFADQIPPLSIKKTEPRKEAPSVSEIGAKNLKPTLRKPSPLRDVIDSGRAPRDSVTALRFHGNENVNGRFESTYLAGVKEESIEDMSITDQKRPSHGPNDEDDDFPLPARIAAVKAMQERRLRESAEKAKARRAARQHNGPLAAIRDLPSLNFSRMDLIDKLNEALEVRPSRSMELVRRFDFTGIYSPSPQRPQSTEPFRERYASFFSKPEDFSSLFEQPSVIEEEDADPRVNDVPTVEVQESTKVEEDANDVVGSRSLSHEDFLNVATQVNRLSIPSISGLSERLSELLPSLRNLHLDSVLASDEDVAHMIDDIQALGHITRRETLLSGRTSAGIRTLAERAEEIVKNGTHDSVLPTGNLPSTNKELPPLPESASADKVSAVNSSDGKQSYLSGSVSAPSDLGKEPARPLSALVRQKSPTTEEEVHQMLPPEMNPIHREAKRPLLLSGVSSRPWNQDENYPWAGKGVDIDLSVPSKAHTKESETTALQRRSQSLEGVTSGETNGIIKDIDTGSITTTPNLERTTSTNTEQGTGIDSNRLRKHSKRSIMRSLSQKTGLGHKHDLRGETTRSVPSPMLKSDDSNQAHKPGDRYPTTGLTPPAAAFNLDEVRSFFSDDSSENKRHTSFRKRLTAFKGKGRSARLDRHNPSAANATSSHHRRLSFDGDTTYDAGGLINPPDRLGASSSAQMYDGLGMGRAEFRMRRLGEKLRHLLAKGGELLRSWSTRAKAAAGPRVERVRQDWLSDSVYSGV